MNETAEVPPPPAGPLVEKTSKPVAGGVLIIIGALIGIATGGLLAAGSSILIPISIPGLSAILLVCGVIWLILSLIGLMGGIFAIQRSHFGLAILGGIFSLLFGGFIFGLIGLILVAISKKEFR